ncbi:protein-histidine kinase [Gigaspora margarita]|uniref:Protein-histidine kinase n=1 Tax=Gigaspora margarita TaxID=4874 RepID=A0A8H4A7Z0_GIGMA|nr:protein-histidine kinase [Gigaspora margarita]
MLYILILGLDKGADDYLIKPFSTRQLITRVRTNIELSHIRRKLLYQQCKQEQIKQLLISISNKILSGSDLKVTLSNIIEEIHLLLPCERIFIISCEPPEFKNQTMIALSEDSMSKAPINGPLMEKSIFNSQEFLNNDSDVDILSDVYCADICKKVSMLSVKIKMKDGYWGWIKAHRPPNSVWLDSEIELLQQISNQLSITIDNANLLRENLEKEMQIKATEIANEVKSRILANTSHELRTPLGAIVGILSSFDDTGLADDQKDMINIMARASDVVLSTINNILDAAKLETNKIILINHAFDLLSLFEDTIELFGERAGAKQIELVMSCEVDKLPKYVMSDPERLKQILSHLLSNSIKFTEEGEVVMKVSLQSQKVTDKSIRKVKILIEIYDTGIGIDPEFMQHVLESLSQGDKSINRRLQGAGLGLSICKKLVEINGGEIKAESQLGKGSKFWFTWNVELLPDIPEFQNVLLKKLFDEQTSYILPYAIRLKRILIIHPVKSVRNAMIKYFEQVKKVNAFDTFDKGIQEIKSHKQLYNRFAYDIVFIGLYEKNEEEVIKTISELREIKTNRDNLLIILITFPSNTGKALAEKLVRKIGGRVTIIYMPITWQKLINQLSRIKDDENCNVECLPVSNHSNTNILKKVADDDNHEDYEYLSTLFENFLNI